VGWSGLKEGESGKLVLTHKRNSAVHIQNPLQPLSTILNPLQPFSTYFNHSQPTSTHLTKIKQISTYFNPLLPTSPIYQPLFTHETNSPSISLGSLIKVRCVVSKAPITISVGYLCIRIWTSQIFISNDEDFGELYATCLRHSKDDFMIQDGYYSRVQDFVSLRAAPENCLFRRYIVDH